MMVPSKGTPLNQSVRVRAEDASYLPPTPLLVLILDADGDSSMPDLGHRPGTRNRKPETTIQQLAGGRMVVASIGTCAAVDQVVSPFLAHDQQQ